MTSEPLWELRVSKPAQKSVQRAPRPERERLSRALEEMQRNPFSGDVARLKDQPTAFRRRVGEWRIFFDVEPDYRIVDVTAIERRTTTTYRKR
jgi:mRNA-degrading endonuclease RelE of RelBE toxin-antitoxin system